MVPPTTLDVLVKVVVNPADENVKLALAIHGVGLAAILILVQNVSEQVTKLGFMPVAIKQTL